MAGGMFVLANNGFGRTASDLSADTMVKLYKATLVAEMGYTVTAMFSRLCVAFFYLRLTPEIWHIWTIRIVMSISTLYNIAYFFVLLFQCMPTWFFWTQFAGDTNGYCLPAMVIIGTTWGHNGASALSDWTLNSLPFFIIIPSMMSWKMKVSAFSLLGMGSLASIGIIVRFIALTTIERSRSAVPLSPAVAWWSELEVCVVMVAANMATYRPLLVSIGRLIRSGSVDKDVPQNFTVFSLSSIRWPEDRRPKRPRRSGYTLTMGFDTQDAQELVDIEQAELEIEEGPKDVGAVHMEFPSTYVGRHDSHSEALGHKPNFEDVEEVT
ncbi:hypothetical protein K490DRAFT_66654 [Saccharata proteae CBS 121410]|uniref:Rhodopsin domain-containing protein n=1 Tax=Saccharata proteae CBS 121410 TaxID=1314787 RepID=A0A9P4LUF3_9PEZI|nr:hypothetical protein K490DRAFT_66654 [Saccharata proteae CBS 121410]